MSLAATVLDEYRLAYDRSNYDAYEHRLSIYGAFQTFLNDTPKLVPGYREFLAGRKYESQTTSIPVINRATFTTTASRSCTALTKENTSDFVDITFTTIVTGFQMIPAQYESNFIGYQADFNRKITDVQRTLLAAMDTAAYTHLNANKSAVNNADGNPYVCAGNCMTVPKADNELFFNEASQVMEQNDLAGPYNVIGSPRLQALVRQYSSQGTSNAENRAFQFGGYSFAYSNRVVIPTGFRDTVFVMPEGALGYLSWVDMDSQLNHKSGDGKEWFVQNLPLLGHDVGVLYQSTCADKDSVLTGLDATLVESWQFSYDYAFISAYNSDTSTLPGVIYCAKFSKT